MEELFLLLPDQHAKQVRDRCPAHLEEIRLRVGQPVLLRGNGTEQWISPCVSGADLEDVLRRACRQSVYAHQETLRQGFVTVDGGHRIGVCGTGVLRDGQVQNLVHPSSLVLRVAREVLECAAGLFRQIQDSTLLIGPPCSGKTTLLRDLIRLLSDRENQRISLADERGEISAALHGVPQLDIGKRTDVLLYIPKKEAMMMLLRTMNPQWIAVDEITAPEDIAALEHASYCGVKLLATAHADQAEDLYRRPLYRSMMEKKIFRTIVGLRPDKSFLIQEV